MSATLIGGRSEGVVNWDMRVGRNIQVLAGTKVLVALDPPFHAFDPDGSDRTITLPAVASSEGKVFLITNWGAAGEQLNVKNASAVQIQAIEAGCLGVFICDGATWYGGSLVTGVAGVGAAAAIASFTAGTNITAATANDVLTDSSATNPSDAQFNELAKEVMVKVNAILAALRASNIILT